MAFQIVRNDIVKMNTDIIVNTANPNACVGDGVDTAIYNAAGMEELLKERTRIGNIPVGEVAVTSGGKLSCRYIFHVSGQYYCDGRHGEAQILRICYEKCLALAVVNQCKSIAFPLLATGSYGFPREEALRIAIDVFSEFLFKHEIDIYLVVFDKKSLAVSGKLFSDVSAYIDDHYVENALQKEYKANIFDETCTLAPKCAYEKENVKAERKLRDIPARHAPMPIKTEHECHASMPIWTEHENEPIKSISNLNDIINNDTGDFTQYLQQLINKKGMTNAEVYRRANLSKQYFSKIMHKQVKPAKEKLLCIAVALRLNIDETIDFLKYGGYALTPYNKVDLVFEYFIKHNIFDIYTIDIALFDCGLPTLTE